jgi:hypothetical protein
MKDFENDEEYIPPSYSIKKTSENDNVSLYCYKSSYHNDNDEEENFINNIDNEIFKSYKRKRSPIR